MFPGLLQDGTILAGYQFESFASGYPKSEKLQEAAYLGQLFYVSYL
jgi:outer membrane protein assembly factor BamD